MLVGIGIVRRTMPSDAILELMISPAGRLQIDPSVEGIADVGGAARRIVGAFEKGPAAGLLHLATGELQTVGLSNSVIFARDFAKLYLSALCHATEAAAAKQADVPPPEEELRSLVQQVPPIIGLEYLDAATLGVWWTTLDEYVRSQAASHAGGIAGYLREQNPMWRLVGRVTFHLAENKRDETHPFAFMATYTSGISSQGQPKHLPLQRALQEYAGANNRTRLLSLLTPIQHAADRLDWVKELVETRALYQPLAWTPRQAYALLRDVPALEDGGLVVRLPDWWKRTGTPRPQVAVKIGDGAKSRLGADTMIDFRVNVALGDQELTEAELDELMQSDGPMVRLRGQWVEIDREKLSSALKHWKRVERESKSGEISFFEGMRLLAGAQLTTADAETAPAQLREWTGITPGKWLDEALAELRSSTTNQFHPPSGLQATLRPYQQSGVQWLSFMTRLGLGACLADDMGLGKTIQILALLLQARATSATAKSTATQPSLLVVPASLIANWQSEIARFAPILRITVAHPSENETDFTDPVAVDAALDQRDLVITTYGMLNRLDAIRSRRWNFVILDEAQAIKNAGARQTRAVKELSAVARVALTGTPIENRLSDLWSLFDFLNPGLLGGAKVFGNFVKAIAKQERPDYAPLRRLISPYILRRLKTDKRVIADLPDKTEVKTYCNLSPQQATMYQQSVDELGREIGAADGIRRRGIVLAYLMRFKQICNHPAQWRGDGHYDASISGKFGRLRDICQELSQRQERVLVFTQFREITIPLAAHLQEIFGRSGLVLHGSSSVPQRRAMVDQFQRDDGPPFFVLSLKAGGTGLNLTAASHVIHFDRWWNPAVENQATDRAFRIGQKRNVMVHKFVCRGTIEEKIDQMIGDKVAISDQLLSPGGTEKLLTEMGDAELMRFVALDIAKATED